ncbi:MAG: four helix bundle protein [Patescibacteria group bacterium]
MTKIQDTKNRKYDLEERTTLFAKSVIRLCKGLPKDNINYCLVGQVVRSAGSIGANYREANDALGKKDFLLRLRISRKEAKESIHWLELLREANNNAEALNPLISEAIELKNILSAIISKSV